MTRKSRPTQPGIAAGDDVAAMIRVDHAGEYGAVRIYEGQLAVLDARKGSTKTAAAIRKMAEQEQRHLKAFDTLLNERRVRPTALEPVWRVAGFALGAATALLGEKAAMACTAAVETVIDEHYAAQIARLDHDPALKAAVEDFRADEIAHRDEALSHGAEDAAGYRLLSETIKAGCRLAIKLSERL
ncbi:MAG TPA: demethoxyubiquinone hydroxylase family protein [Rhizomicrobium sp.]|nr:demethoxyubiquinone hydroxylase family protein [Rhizomicrobium sp.]